MAIISKTQSEARKRGHKFFNTGKPCIYGHLSDRYAASRRCVTCDRNRWDTQEYKTQRRIRWKKNSHRYAQNRAYRIYGIDKEKLKRKQKGRCAICLERFISGKSCHVDHCHTTKIVRGLLCNLCNRGIGAFRDDPKLLRSAIKYLRRKP